MDKLIEAMHQRIQRLLTEVNDELLELSQQSALTYSQYAALANSLVDAQRNLKRMLQGEASVEMASGSGIPIPLWLFTNETISPPAKWTYAHLLKLRREVGRPGRNALVINLDLVSKDIFHT